MGSHGSSGSMNVVVRAEAGREADREEAVEGGPPRDPAIGLPVATAEEAAVGEELDMELPCRCMVRTASGEPAAPKP